MPTCPRFALLALILFVTACAAPPQVVIDEPINGSFSTSQPSIYKITFLNGAIPPDFSIQLNGTDVTSSFDITATGAVAAGSLLVNHVISGNNLFKAIYGTDEQFSSFYYDDIGPTVHILSANRMTGAMTGYLDDPSGAVSLSIDGVSVPLDAQSGFELPSFPFLTLNEFVASDTNGFESTSTYISGEQVISPSLSLRLNNGGFAFLAEQLEDGLDDFNFGAAMEMINPIYSGLLYDLSMSDFNFDRPSISLEVVATPSQTEQQLHIVMNIPNFIAALTLDEPFPLGSTTGTASVDNIYIETDATISIVNSDLDFAIENTTLILDNLVIDLDSTFYTTILNTFADLLLPNFIAVVEQLAVPILSEFIGQILISTDITVDDKTMNILIEPTELLVSELGLTVDIASRVSAPEPDLNTVPTIGSLFKLGDLPSLGATSPDGSAFDVGVSISANLINQALFAAHEAGVTTLTLSSNDSAGTDPEGVSVIQSQEDDIQTADVITLRLLPASPPFVKLMQGDNLHGLLGWYDTTLAMDLQRVGWTEPQNVFTATFNLEVPFELGATEAGFLHIGIEQLPVIDIYNFSNSGAIPLSSTFINKLVQYAMPVVMPYVSTKLDAVLLPTIGGYRIHAEELWVSGTGDANFSLAGSLVPNATTDAAAAPTSTLALTTKNVDNTINSEAIVAITEVSNTTILPLEYSYRLDGGSWSNWKQRSSIKFSQLLGGHHIIEVCSRTVLMKRELNCPIVEFDTTVAP